MSIAFKDSADACLSVGIISASFPAWLIACKSTGLTVKVVVLLEEAFQQWGAWVLQEFDVEYLWTWSQLVESQNEEVMGVDWLVDGMGTSELERAGVLGVKGSEQLVLGVGRADRNWRGGNRRRVFWHSEAGGCTDFKCVLTLYSDNDNILKLFASENVWKLP